MDADPKSRFLKNYSKSRDGKGRKQNFGINNISTLSKNIATWLKKPPGYYTLHSFCRSGATSLAESGISVIELCHAGRWASQKTAAEYQEHSERGKGERADRLDGVDVDERAKKKGEGGGGAGGG